MADAITRANAQRTIARGHATSPTGRAHATQAAADAAAAAADVLRDHPDELKAFRARLNEAIGTGATEGGSE